MPGSKQGTLLIYDRVKHLGQIRRTPLFDYIGSDYAVAAAEIECAQVQQLVVVDDQGTVMTLLQALPVLAMQT